MRRRAGWLVLAALVFFGLLLSQAPSRLLVHAMEGRGVHVASWSGTVWQGRAERVVVRLPEGDWHLGVVSWQLKASSWWRLRPTVAVSTQWQAQRISGNLTWQGPGAVLLEDVALQVPAAVLSAWLPIDVQGTLTSDIERVQWRDNRLDSAQGRVVWDNAAWRGTASVHTLGRYVLELSEQSPGDIVGRILTLSGPVQIAGEARVEQGQRYAVQLGIGPKGRLPEELEEALGLIATPQEDSWDLQLKGAW